MRNKALTSSAVPQRTGSLNTNYVEPAKAWLTYATASYAEEHGERLAESLDQVLRHHLPNQACTGLLANSAAEIRQESLLLLLARYLPGNLRLIAATRTRQLPAITMGKPLTGRAFSRSLLAIGELMGDLIDRGEGILTNCKGAVTLDYLKKRTTHVATFCLYKRDDTGKVYDFSLSPKRDRFSFSELEARWQAFTYLASKCVSIKGITQEGDEYTLELQVTAFDE